MKKKILTISSIVLGVLLIAGGILAYLYFKPPTQEELNQYEETLTEADMLIEAHEYSEAGVKYNSAVKIIPTDARAYSKIVSIYLLKNDFEKALEIAQKVQSRSNATGVSLIYADIAEKYLENDNYYEAKVNYEIATSLNSNPTTNLGLAKTYVHNSEFDLAKKLLSEQFGSDTIDEASLLYAYILGTEDSDQAKEFIDNYTVTDEEKSSYFQTYSLVLDSLTDDELFNITKLSRIYINAGYPTLAIRILEPRREDITQYVDALYYLGKAYLDTKQYDKALDMLAQSASLLGYEADKYWMLGRTYFKKDDLVNAVTYYDMAIEYASDDIDQELVKEYLDILLSSNQISKAENVYTDIAKTVESEWLYLIGLDLYYQPSGNAKFDYYLDKLSEMDMDDTEKKEYLFWKIRKALDESETENIETDFEQLLSLDRFNPKYYWLKGVYNISQSDNQSAKNNFELALEYDLQGTVTQEVEDLLAQLE
jgi:tetratricopeptide (TPR) repeat protein